MLKNKTKKFKRNNTFKTSRGMGVIDRDGLTFIAPDTNIIIDIIHKKRNPNKSYVSLLVAMMQKCARDGYGKINSNGRFVLCLLPDVYEELKRHKNGKDCIGFLANRMIPISIDYKKKEEFDMLVKKLVDEYKKHGLFIDKNGNPTTDAKIIAQASILNLTVVSRDNHMTGEYRKNPENNKNEIIDSINRNFIHGIGGSRAIPIKLTELAYRCQKGYPFPSPETSPYLGESTKSLLSEFYEAKDKKKEQPRTKNP